jgi:hypothetical protein
MYHWNVFLIAGGGWLSHFMTSDLLLLSALAHRSQLPIVSGTCCSPRDEFDNQNTNNCQSLQPQFIAQMQTKIRIDTAIFSTLFVKTPFESQFLLFTP